MEVYALTLVSANRCSQQNYVIDNLSDCLRFISEILTDSTKYVAFKQLIFSIEISRINKSFFNPITLTLNLTAHTFVLFFRYFFGSDYDAICPTSDTSFDCYTVVPPRNNSIMSSLFPRGGYDLSLVDRFLFVEYSSPPGGYE